MAEGRILKKKISLNEAVADLKDDTSRLLFTWGLAHADVDGFLTAKPRQFKAAVCPLLEHVPSDRIQECFQEWEKVGLVTLHDTPEGPAIRYPKFNQNQKNRRDKEAESIYARHIPGILPDDAGTTPGVNGGNGKTPRKTKTSSNSRTTPGARPDNSGSSPANKIRYNKIKKDNLGNSVNKGGGPLASKSQGPPSSLDMRILQTFLGEKAQTDCPDCKGEGFTLKPNSITGNLITVQCPCTDHASLEKKDYERIKESLRALQG